MSKASRFWNGLSAWTTSVLGALLLVGITSTPAQPDEPQGQADSQVILRDARAALKAGDEKRAIAILSRLPPKDGASHFAAGSMLVDAKAYAAGAVEFGKARQTYPDPYLAGYNQTLAYERAGDHAAAINTANELLNQGHETADLAILAAEAYSKSGKAREAYNALRLATKLDPKNEDAYVELCELALDRDDYDLGLEITNIGLAQLPRSERLYLQRGVMRAMKGQFGEAESDYTTAQSLAPQEALPDVALGLVAMQAGQLQKSVDILRRAAARHPDHYLAQFWFATALLHAGATPNTKEGDEALSALQTSVRLNPEFWHSRADLGKELLDRGEVDPAIAQLRKAASLNPKASSPLYLLARAYKKKGDDQAANELMERVSRVQAEEREPIPEVDLKRLLRPAEQ
jgi:tetratricopeptide (TPR) repeat protein